MTVAELIKKLQEYPENTEVKIFDWRKNLNSDSGDGSSSGIYDFKVDMETLDDEEKSFFHEFHGKDHIPFVELTFDNEDYTQKGELCDQ